MDKDEVTVLDCSLRDGGYYNNWDFDPATVQRYLNACAAAGVDVIEIGFRLTPKNTFLGPFAYSTDFLLNSVWKAQGPRLAVMVNASDFLEFPNRVEAAVTGIFHKSSCSRVEIVRISADPDEVDGCEIIARALKGLGYTVILSLMQVGGQPAASLSQIGRKVRGWDAVDILYFSDSLGAMTPGEVTKAVQAFRSGWPGPLGIHAHDNCQRAMANCLAAYEAGATWLDSSVLGIGRGAGNARTEYLLNELSEIVPNKGYNPVALYPLVVEDFQALMNQYRWGSNIIYYLTARHGIHPAYAQRLLDDGRYSTEQVFDALESLRESASPASYSQQKLSTALNGPAGTEEGSGDATHWALNRDVLILGAGGSVNRYRDALLDYIDRRSPIVLCLNVNNILSTSKIDAYVACHRMRLMIESHRYHLLDRLLIAPRALIPTAVAHQFEDVRLLDYGLAIAEGRFEIGHRGCVLPAALAAPYALAFATAAGARRILLAGFDGYGAQDPRQAEMVQVFEAYQQLPNKVPVIALTPSTYPVNQSSIFAPSI
jgi:4-hydroxy 2-oxovalerate aldolase